MKKVIFLDIDGVINCESTIDNLNPYTKIDSSLVYSLSRIVSITNSKIILISDWKEYWNKDKEKQHEIGNYIDYRLSCEDIKITNKIQGNSNLRGKSIVEFIKQNNIKYYVILDDNVFDYKEQNLIKHLVKTNSKYGLTDSNVIKAIKILG